MNNAIFACVYSRHVCLQTKYSWPQFDQELSRRPTLMGQGARELGLDDVLLVDRLASQHTLKAEARDVDLVRVGVGVRVRVRVRVILGLGYCG